MHESLKHRAFMFLKSRPATWFNGGEIEELAFGAGYKASNLSRRLRELHEAGKIERELRKTNGGPKSVWYRYVPSQYERMNSAYGQTGQLKLS